MGIWKRFYHNINWFIDAYVETAIRVVNATERGAIYEYIYKPIYIVGYKLLSNIAAAKGLFSELMISFYASNFLRRITYYTNFRFTLSIGVNISLTGGTDGLWHGYCWLVVWYTLIDEVVYLIRILRVPYIFSFTGRFSIWLVVAECYIWLKNLDRYLKLPWKSFIDFFV